MLIKVLNEDVRIELKDYGTINIPKGTAVNYKDYGDSHVRYCPVNEFSWINENYSDQSGKMRYATIEHKILIPKEKLMPALRVRFIYDDSGSCRDIYKNIYGNKKYCRMESHIRDKVQWLTITDDWEEPHCPLRSDMLIQLVDKDDKVIITEQQVKIDGEYATSKDLLFSWENPETEEQKRLMKLIYKQ